MVKGRAGRGQQQSSHMSNQAAASNNVECPHQKSPIQGHMSSFCCKVCGEAFSHMGHLHVHVQVHTREKPYRCGVCGKCCSSSGRLQEHQRSHTGEKPFRCQICGKGFTQMAHLKVHMRIHTGEKPYSCPVCGKCFSRSDKIKRHLQTHNRDGQYFSGSAASFGFADVQSGAFGERLDWSRGKAEGIKRNPFPREQICNEANEVS
ncbi:hypothetical protein WMY93_011190 [Mugilogobius chulae]|uniref:C2H2-type domain-containing protein n=1 Tax=Mugilogobius chulae TaxID=88201 RepID=A0AAW0PAU7_9GOBI